MEKISIYLAQNTKNKIGGNFYNVYVSKKDDLKIGYYEDVSELEASLKEQDEDVKKAGGIIVGKNEYIDDAIVYSNYDGEEKKHALTINDIDEEILELYYKKDVLFKEYLKQVVEIDQEIRELYSKKEEVEVGYQKKLGM